MRADVARTNGTKQGICQRMECDIRIRMAFQPLIMGDVDAAKPNAVTRLERMHIKAKTRPHIGEAFRDQGVRPFNIARRGNFEIRWVSLNHRNLNSRAPGEGCIIGVALARKCPMRRQNGCKRKSLWCLRRDNLIPIERAGNQPASEGFEAVRYSERGKDSVSLGQFVQATADQFRTDKGPGRIMNKHKARRMIDQALQPVSD